MMRAVHTFHADFKNQSILIYAGTELADNDPIVKAFSPLFEPVEDTKPKPAPPRRGR